MQVIWLSVLALNTCSIDIVNGDLFDFNILLFNTHSYKQQNVKSHLMSFFITFNFIINPKVSFVISFFGNSQLIAFKQIAYNIDGWSNGSLQIMKNIHFIPFHKELSIHNGIKTIQNSLDLLFDLVQVFYLLISSEWCHITI